MTTDQKSPKTSEVLQIENGMILPIYGIYTHEELGIVTPLAMASFRNAEDLISSLAVHDFGESVVVTPELVAAVFTDIDFDFSPAHREKIAEAQKEILQISQAYPNTKYVIGGVDFHGPQLLNTLFIIQNGQIVGKSYKRMLNQIELENFSPKWRHNPPFEVADGVDILICSDIIAAPTSVDEDLEHTPPSTDETYGASTAMRFGKFIHQDAHTLIVSSCWGIPGYFTPSDLSGYVSKAKETHSLPPQATYFLDAQKGAAESIFVAFKNIHTIIFVDRALEEISLNVSPIPLNSIYRRE